MPHYFAFVFTDAGGYGFVAPDIPGFTAHAETEDFSEAVSIATRVLADHVAAMHDNRADLPAARSLAELRADPGLADDWAEAATTVMLPALIPAGRTLRINISLDENTLAQIDRQAAERSITRSAFLAEAARAYIA